MRKIIFFILFLIVNFVLAQNGIDVIQSKTMQIVSNIIRFLFSALMLIAGVLLVILGIKYIVAKGKIEELHQSLIYLIIGLVLLVTSLFVPNLIKNFIESLIQ